MTKRRILLATPMKSGLSRQYLAGLVPLLKDGLPDCEVEFMTSSGLSVVMARNDLAWYAMDGKYDDVIMTDEDMLWTPANLSRLLSLDADVVGMPYCKHVVGAASWLFIPLKGAEKQPNGLLECSVVGTGCFRIQVRALDRIKAYFPDLSFSYKEPQQETARLMTFFFEIGLVGPGSSEGRLDRVREILTAGMGPDTMRQLRDATFGEEQPSGLVGEDYRFCMRARQAGLRVWVDLGEKIMPHVGPCAYPITPDMVGFRDDIPQAMPAPNYFLENFGAIEEGV